MRDRKKCWTYEDADWIGSSPALAPEKNLLFIGLEFGLWRKHGGIAALNLRTGALVWKRNHPELTHCTPLYIAEEDLVVICSNNAIVYAYQASNGTPRWELAIDAPVKSSFAYDRKRNLIIFGGLGSVLYAVAARTGTVVYAKDVGVGTYSTPWIEKDTVYYSSLDKLLYAFDIDTWAERWSFRTSGRIFASPMMAGDSLWCGSNDGRLYELDPLNGSLRGSFQLTERIVNRIAYNPISKRIFVTSQTNEMVCLKRNDVQIKQQDTEKHP